MWPYGGHLQTALRFLKIALVWKLSHLVSNHKDIESFQVSKQCKDVAVMSVVSERSLSLFNDHIQGPRIEPRLVFVFENIARSHHNTCHYGVYCQLKALSYTT